MNSKQLKRAMHRNDRQYHVYADFRDSECIFAAAHLLMGNNASFRRIKKAAKALMQTGKFTEVNFRDSGHLITSKSTQQKVEGLARMSQRELELNPHWPNLVRFYVKMNKCAERINAQYA